jgi:septin family protein
MEPEEANYLLPHFTMLVVGKPGSGKTTVVRNLLTSKQFYKKKFDHVLIISPSANKMEIPV